jgi:hypothetical protein
MSSEERWKKQFLIDNDWDEIRERCLEVIRIIGHDIPIKKVATEDKYDV